MTPEEKYRDLYEQMYDLCKEQGWGDPFSYARSREIYMAGLLGHRVAADYAGEDATDEDGGCEYKSTIGKNINGTYNGISVQDTWEEQEKYIKEDKIGKYPNHYYAKFKDGKIIVCPECNKVTTVYHFSWSALGCQECGAMVEKNQWRLL